MKEVHGDLRLAHGASYEMKDKHNPMGDKAAKTAQLGIKKGFESADYIGKVL